MYLLWELCKIPFSLHEEAEIIENMCVTGLEVSCSGNIKRTLGSSSGIQDTVHSYRDKWMWWGREKRSVASLFSACRAWNRQAGLEGRIGLHLSSVGRWQIGWTGHARGRKWSSPHRKSAPAWSRDQSNWQSEKHYSWLPVLESPWLPTIVCLASSAV